MHKCWRCKFALTEENNSVEHIIPNALGGRIKAKNLLCKRCNNIFGETIDVELIQQVGHVATLLGVKRDRPNANAFVIGKKANGEDVRVGPKLRPFSVLLLNTPDGKEISFYKSTENEMVSYARGHKRRMESKGIKVDWREWTELPNDEKVYFPNNKSTTFNNSGYGGKDFYEAIAKIAINFYLMKGGKSEFIEEVIQFVSQPSESNPYVRFYYSDEIVHKLLTDEVSHLLYLRGDTKRRILYCYIELFSAHNLLVKLSTEYDGPELKEIYCFELVLQKEVEKELFLFMTEPFLLEFRHLNLGNIQEHTNRNNRMRRIIEKLQKNNT